RKIGSPGAAVYDRLGTKRLDLRGPFERAGYFPYGEEQQATTSPKEYATYTRGAAGLDYADQRYYASTSGRFLTPDPYRASAAPENPQSWNRYAYVGNDPVNFNDPTGLAQDGGDPRRRPSTATPPPTIGLSSYRQGFNWYSAPSGPAPDRYLRARTSSAICRMCPRSCNVHSCSICEMVISPAAWCLALRAP